MPDPVSITEKPEDWQAAHDAFIVARAEWEAHGLDEATARNRRVKAEVRASNAYRRVRELEQEKP